MKNIISKNITNQTKELVNQTRNTFTNEKKQFKITSSKLIKGKVKVYTNSRPKLNNSDYLDDESELYLVSERMLLFLKFALVFLTLTALFILFKKNG
ncbi:hypothetical protein [Flavobacterium granuli]|uniref:Ribosome-associated RNA-binding protein Tma20 n=1 Tax=Flavobacterium granuli TaxID=280093 RepID=A0ABU1RZP7_9FLAO|nr:hypothetical protein [Flavobacterium granuli]MDR6844255.1 putative ribosome-associated RNA-binding protein Tma20 [Flavobacterium granuli]